MTTDFDDTFKPIVSDPTGIDHPVDPTDTHPSDADSSAAFPLTIVLIAAGAGLAFLVIIIVSVVVVMKRNAARQCGPKGPKGVPSFRMKNGDRAVINPVARPAMFSLTRMKNQESEVVKSLSETGGGLEMAKKEYATAAFRYEAVNGDELSFNKGDKIEVLEAVTSSSSGTGWGRGRIDGRTGYFPSNYIITDVE